MRSATSHGQPTMPDAAPSRAEVTLALASVSPRRRLLLSDAGFAPKVCEPGIDDAQLKPPPGAPPHCWTAALAYLKARAARALAGVDAGASTLLLAADTVVVKQDAIIGQARDEADARRILRTLAGGRHRVITGVAILLGERRLLFADTADVTVGPLEDRLVEPYLASGQWRGKAGAYNLLERIEAGWPITYSGDPTTIMGLPMRRLTPILRDLLGRAHGEPRA